MIWMQVKNITMDEGVRYCAVCRFNDNQNTFSYYSVDHESRKGFIKRVVKTIRHEFKIKPEVI